MRALSLTLIGILIIIGIAHGQQPPAPPPPSPFQNIPKPLVVCAAPIDPFVICNTTEPTDAFTGFDIELFRLAATEINLVENVDYVFKCMNFTDMIDELKLVNGTCDVGIGAITINSERQDEGIQFTYPTYSTALSILVKATDQRAGGWAWVQPFSYELWLAVGVTVVIFPALLFLIEFGSLKRRIYLQDAVTGLDVATTRAMQTLMSSEPLEVSSSGAKVASLVFLFMALILINTYTANLAAALTVNQINSQITSVDQLKGKAVATNSAYLEKLRSRYGILAVELNSNDPNMLPNAAAAIIKGELTAVITDEPLIENLLQTTPGCDIRQLSNSQVEPFNYGFAVREGLNPAFVGNLSTALLGLQENGDLQNLAEVFLGFNFQDDCGNLKEVDYSIGFYSLYGLWVLLGGGIVLGFILMFFSRHRRGFHKKKKTRRNLVGDGKSGNTTVNGREGGGQGPMPQRRDLVTLGGISEEVEENDLEQQDRDAIVAVTPPAGPQVSVKKNSKPSAASAKWREVMDNMSALQTRSSIFTPSTWASRDDLERQKTLNDSSDEE